MSQVLLEWSEEPPEASQPKCEFVFEVKNGTFLEFFFGFFYLLCHFSNENCLRGNSISADVILLLVLVIHGPPGSFVKCAEPKIRNCWRLASLTRGLSMLSTISIASRRRRSRRAASVTFLECIEACFSSQREKYT